MATDPQDGLFEPLGDFPAYAPAEMLARARALRDDLKRRRSVRAFADRPVPEGVLRACLETAGSAPSGANRQPWHFAVIGDPVRRRRLREAAEAEEAAFHRQRATPEWLEALAPLGTDADKPYLESAPVLIAIFAQRFGQGADGRRVKHFHVPESVGIATGFLLVALHRAGLASLVHTPSPMGFLNELCLRPPEDKPFALVVAGFPADQCRVPVHGRRRKPLDEVVSWL